jgi:hypothetical protein
MSTMVLLRVKRHEPEVDPNIHLAPTLRMCRAIILFPPTRFCAWNRERYTFVREENYSRQHFPKMLQVPLNSSVSIFMSSGHVEIPAFWLARQWVGTRLNMGQNRTRIILIDSQPETGKKYALRNVMDFMQRQRQWRKTRGNFLVFYGTVNNKSFLLLKYSRSVLESTQLPVE